MLPNLGMHLAANLLRLVLQKAMQLRTREATGAPERGPPDLTEDQSLLLWKYPMPCFTACLVATPHPAFFFPQFSLVAPSCPTLCDPMNRSTPVLPVHHQLPEFTQTHVHQVDDASQTPHILGTKEAEIWQKVWWELVMDREDWRAAIHGVAKSQT